MYKVENVWSDWKVVRLIGEGSFGKVYEIVRNNFGIEEHSALKVITIPTSTAEAQSFRNEGMDENSVTEYYRGLVKDFVQEIALMSKLKGNPGIVAYEDYAVLQHQNDVGWDILIRMELLHPLPELMRNHNLSESEVVDLGISMCEALSICHSNNIIHRDIKLDNIFISDNGYYKLGDFGVARTIEKTASGLSKKGTYTYMAPEVYKGESYGQNVDIYSLGMVMYRLLNFNREPFLPLPPENIKYNDKNEALVKRMQGQTFEPPANACGRLGEVIMKACSFNPVNRFSTTDEMKQELEKIKMYFLNTKSNPDITNEINYVPAADQTENSVDEGKTVSAFDSESFVQKSTAHSEVYNSTVGADSTRSEMLNNSVEIDSTQSAFCSDRFNFDKTDSVSFISSDYSGNINHSSFNKSNKDEGTVSAFYSSAASNSSNVSYSAGVKNYSENVIHNSFNQSNRGEGTVSAFDASPVGNSSNVAYANEAKSQKNNGKGKIIAGLSLGWIGVLFDIIFIVIFFPLTVIQTIAIIIGMIMFSAKKYSTALWVIMIIASVLSFSVLNLISVLILSKECMNKN